MSYFKIFCQYLIFSAVFWAILLCFSKFELLRFFCKTLTYFRRFFFTKFELFPNFFCKNLSSYEVFLSISLALQELFFKNWATSEISCQNFSYAKCFFKNLNYFRIFSVKILAWSSSIFLSNFMLYQISVKIWAVSDFFCKNLVFLEFFVNLSYLNYLCQNWDRNLFWAFSGVYRKSLRYLKKNR